MTMYRDRDLAEIKKKLDEILLSPLSKLDLERARELFISLDSFPVTLEILKKTRIGVTVNRFRKKCHNPELVELCKALIKNWKQLIPAIPERRRPSAERVQNNTGEVKDDQAKPTENKAEATSSKMTKMTRPGHSETSDPVRLKCRDLLNDALSVSCDVVKPHRDVREIAMAVEQCIYLEIKSTDQKYRNRIRSRVSNLKDVKNPRLRQSVLLGAVSCERLAVMTAEEMASDELNETRAKQTQDAINEHQMAVNTGTDTDLVQCEECNSKKCTYNQVQTLCADEPMTTFVLCYDCGYRWKFN